MITKQKKEIMPLLLLIIFNVQNAEVFIVRHAVQIYLHYIDQL
jgi:hypothetical protein